MIKRLICLLAALLILAGCGDATENQPASSTPDTKKEPVTLELTPDNFYDYFYITMKTDESYDSYDELSRVIVFYSLELKEELLDEVTALKLKAFDYQVVNPSLCTFVYDFDTKTFQIEEFDADLAAALDYSEEQLLKEKIAKDDTNNLGFDLESFKSDYFHYITFNQTPPWTTIDTGIIEGNLYKTVGIQYEGFNITRVNGEITINK